uniref:ClpB_D2-small domain-containing protein n=1 Tax=Heterorhabditis bacteriophora TaxID=37862 RepID=A0A1I7WTF5_HETBA
MQVPVYLDKHKWPGNFKNTDVGSSVDRTSKFTFGTTKASICHRQCVLLFSIYFTVFCYFEIMYVQVDLSFSAEALQQVAQLALERKTGARALRSIFENVLLDAKFMVPGSDIEGIHVTREAVRGEAEVEYIRRELKQAASGR